jgi:hypothetical protein
MVRTLLQMPLIPRALESGGFEWAAEAPGTTAHRLPALRAEATTAAAAVPPATVSGAPPIEPFRDGGAQPPAFPSEKIDAKEKMGCPTFAQAYVGRKRRGEAPPKLLKDR